MLGAWWENSTPLELLWHCRLCVYGTLCRPPFNLFLTHPPPYPYPPLSTLNPLFPPFFSDVFLLDPSYLLESADEAILRTAVAHARYWPEALGEAWGAAALERHVRRVEEEEQRRAHVTMMMMGGVLGGGGGGSSDHGHDGADSTISNDDSHS